MTSGVVLSYSERADLASEASSAGAELAAALGVASLATELDEVSPGLRPSGRIVLAKGERVLEADPDLAAGAIVEVAKAKGLVALCVGETRFGTLVAAKVAARLNMASLGRGKGFRVEGGRLLVDRDAYGGRFIAKVAASLPCVAVVQAGSYKAGVSTPAEVETITIAPGEKTTTTKVLTVSTKQAPQGESDLKSAAIIVSAGRGFAKKDDLALARDLATALGATLGCSRPLSSDLGWLGEESHIGLTGVYVHPKLYIAVGISGQLQHVAGIKDSKVIVAINKDRQAPIFQVADYGIVGDLYEVIPALTKVLRQT